ncbi:MAG TPA: EamA family transporter, partial [Terriglobia bacterium]|nr:EamA family transporter [Terriglobia bacterium]
MRTAIALLVLVLAGTGGDLALAHAMKRLGEVHSFTPAAIWRFLRGAFREGWMWIGIAQLTLAFCSLLALLSWEAVSFVIPANALSYVTGAIGGKYFLGEKLTPLRWAGIGLISVGVALV